MVICTREYAWVGYVYALMVYHQGVNEQGQVGLDFFIVRVGDGSMWPKDERHGSFEPIALYARRATAIKDSTAQVGAYLADIVQRRGKLGRSVVPSVRVITLDELEDLYADIVGHRAEYDAAMQAYHAERGAQLQAEKQAKREARKAEKREPLATT